MKSYDSQGRLVGEINAIFAQDGTVITCNSVYNPTNGQPISQNITVRDSQGRVTLWAIRMGGFVA